MFAYLSPRLSGGRNTLRLSLLFCRPCRQLLASPVSYGGRNGVRIHDRPSMLLSPCHFSAEGFLSTKVLVLVSGPRTT